MLKQHITSSLLPDSTANCRIYNPLIIDNSLTSQSINVNGNVTVDKSVLTEESINIAKNTTVSGKVKFDGSTTIQEGLFMTNSSNINMNNKKVINVPTQSTLSSANDTLACNYGMMQYPVFYCKTSSSSTNFSWGQSDILPWNVLIGRLYRSPNFNNYFRLENNGNIFRILRTGIFQFSMAITKKRGSNNGYGEHILLRKTSDTPKPICREQIWNKGGINLQVCLTGAVHITSANLSGAAFEIARERGGGTISLSMFSFSVLGFLEV